MPLIWLRRGDNFEDEDIESLKQREIMSFQRTLRILLQSNDSTSYRNNIKFISKKEIPKNK
jgi:hypothetical protein